MANSRFSSLSNRASGAFSGIRSRFGGGSRGQDRRDDGYDDYGYDDYGYDDGYDGGRYADSAVYDDYGEYGYDPDEPYDDYTGAEGIGEVRTRSVSSGSYTHPPLVSFDEARTNTYVPDRLMRDPLEHLPSRSSRTSSRYSSGYTPRVRDSVNVGSASEYDFASVGGARLDSTGAEIPPSSVVDAAPAPAASPASPSAMASTARDSRALYSKPGERSFVPTRKLKVLSPAGYGEVEAVAHALKAGDAVVLALAQTPDDLAKRVLDFSFGAASALDASVECIADKTFAVCRGAALSDAERAALAAQGVLARGGLR